MKAIYINIDPYLQTVADWLNAGKPGTAPCFDPLPVAVTIPLGEEPVLFVPAASTGNGQSGKIDPSDPDSDWDSAQVSCGDFTLLVWTDGFTKSSSTLVDSAITPGLSSVDANTPYAAMKFTGGNVNFSISGFEFSMPSINFTVPVLVRRETASGPVDLVDFTPPASGTPSAADIRSALVEAGANALEGVSLGGAIIDSNEGTSTMIQHDGTAIDSLKWVAESDAVKVLGTDSAS